MLKEAKLAEAMNFTEQILSFLDQHTMDGTDEPMRIYFTCYQALKANQDPRADEVLKNAYNLLMERAERIEDESMRRSYLVNVEANREIVKASGLQANAA